MSRKRPRIISSSSSASSTPTPSVLASSARTATRKKKAVRDPSLSTGVGPELGSAKVRRVVRKRVGKRGDVPSRDRDTACPVSEAKIPANVEPAEVVPDVAVEGRDLVATPEPTQTRVEEAVVGPEAVPLEVEDAYGALYRAAGDTLDTATVHEMAAELIAKADVSYDPKTRVWGPHTDARTTCRSLTPHVYRACVRLCEQHLTEAEHWAADVKAVLDGVLERARKKPDHMGRREERPALLAERDRT